MLNLAGLSKNWKLSLSNQKDFHFNVCAFLKNFFLVFLLIYSVENISAKTPLSKNEVVIFSFETKNSKTVSLVKDSSDKYIVYRISKNDKIEMEFPEKTSDSWKKLTYSFYLRGGGKENEGVDLNYVNFENNGFKYIIYDIASSRDSVPSIGVRVIENKTSGIINLEGIYDSKKGSLTDFRDNNLINKSEETFD
jgi:hypothetical protein